jgi:hypothetical protein
MKNRLVDKHLADNELAMGLLNTLTSNELLSKPKSVSSHLAICIGKILNRHIDDAEFCASIDSFYQNKVKQVT